jgi:hypothetical protein
MTYDCQPIGKYREALLPAKESSQSKNFPNSTVNDVSWETSELKLALGIA